MRSFPLTALLGATLGLAACVKPEPETRLSIVTRATEPAYQYRADGRIAASACLSGRPASYGSTPSACAVDTAFAQQARHPRDLVHPHPPGPGATYPAAAAAYEYIYGEMPDDPQSDGPQPGILVPVEPGPNPDEADQTN